MYEFCEVYTYLRHLQVEKIIIAQLEENIKEKSYKITTDYSNQPVAKGNSQSKVEVYCIKQINLQERVNKRKQKMNLYLLAIHITDLTIKEKALIEYLIENNYLIGFAKKIGISARYVYNIKDQAIRKITDTLNSMR